MSRPRDYACWARGLIFLIPIAAAAAAAQSTPAPEQRTVVGRVVLGKRQGPRPVPNVWVTVHRVATDRSDPIPSAPLDSVRTGADGRYTLRYRVAGPPSAVYFASTRYGGIAYFTSALRESRVSGDDAQLIVFDTTSGPYPIGIGGRHLIVFAPQEERHRAIGEVFELSNDSTLTLISRDSQPVWRTHIPAGATGFRLNEEGDVGASSVRHAGQSVDVFAPLSPGLRQLAFTYTLPPDAFPVTIPIERPTDLLEVLVQEPAAIVDGATLTEVAPVSDGSVTLRRFLAQNVPANAVVRIQVPAAVESASFRAIVIIAATLGTCMLVAAGTIAVKRRAPAGASVATRPDRLLHMLASIDASFERIPSPTVEQRADHEQRRAALKSELSAMLGGNASRSS